MPRQYKQRILSLIGAALTFSSLNVSNNSFAVQASANEINEPQSTPSQTVTIGVTNEGDEITVDGKNYEVDDNSFVFNYEGKTFAYDIHSNLLKGQMDFKEIFQIPEEEITNYNICQVSSRSNANVRSSGEIRDDNIISSVPSGDYVLAYKSTSAENNKEWLKVLVISNGNICEGYMREDVLREIDDFEETIDDAEKNMENGFWVNTSGDSYVNLNLRSSPKTGTTENIITKIPHGTLIQHTGIIQVEDNRTWALVTYRTHDGKSTFEGWVIENFLTQEMVSEKPIFKETKDNTAENLMFVDTSADNKVPLKLRSSTKTGTTENIIEKIPHGSSVQVLSEVTKSANRNWVFVRYVSPDGNELEGWVASDYLTKELISENIKTNATGNLTGIDVSMMDASILKEVLQNKIPENVSTNKYSYNTSQLAGDINYVYMKLGGSGYGKGNLSIIKNYDAYDEQVAVCEELGVPYGFYYYSTAITVEEAQMELAAIQEKIEALRQKYNMDHNLLEIVVDFELHWDVQKDRQYRGNIEEQTKAKAALINGIQELGLSDNVLIYGPGRVMQHDKADQIIDLDLLHSLLNSPENVKLWLCSHIKTNGNYGSTLEKDIAYAKERGFTTVATQLVLDVKMNGSHIDINNMDLDHFNKLTQQQTNDNISSSIEIEDDER